MGIHSKFPTEPDLSHTTVLLAHGMPSIMVTSSRLFLRQTGELANDPQSFGCAGPMPFKHFGTGVPGYRPQGDGNDDDDVGVADHRDEVGNQVDWHDQVGHEQAQSYPHTPWQRGINGQAAEQPY